MIPASVSSLNSTREFMIGDVVKLMSGGIPMTIKNINNGRAYVVWMDHKGQMQEHNLDVATIRFLFQSEWNV